MSQIINKTALITGAASGIGKLLGKMLLQKGLQTLVAWDQDEQRLNVSANELTKQGFHVLTYVVDVMDTSAVIAAAEQVKKDTGGIDILVNNAGIIVGKPFAGHSHNDIDRTMGINSTAFMHITKAFLPAMIEEKSGHIINIASAAGLVSNPGMSVYVASKWAVTGWSDSLFLEMKKMGSHVHVTTVTPYYINTGMFEGVKTQLVPMLDPGIAARKIMKGIENNNRFVRMPRIVYILPFVKGILPASWFDIIVGKWLGVYKSMDSFTGRQ